MCSFWQYGSAETLIFSGAGAVPAKLILPPIDADPLAAPPAAPAPGAAACVVAGAAAGASCFSPPPQATKARGAASATTARVLRMNIT